MLIFRAEDAKETHAEGTEEGEYFSIPNPKSQFPNPNWRSDEEGQVRTFYTPL
jgi:hypothetical protein